MPTVMQLLPNLSTGGAEKSTLEIADALRARGWRSIIVCAGGTQVESARALGSEVIELELARKSLGAIASVLKLRAMVKKFKPDVVHVRSRLPAWIWRFAQWRLARRPITVSTLHGMNSVSAYSSIMLKADALIAVSKTCAEYWHMHYPEFAKRRFQVISRGIDMEFFASQARSDLHADIGPWLLLPGRGSRLKGHRDAVELIGMLKRRGTRVGLILLGARERGREHYVRKLEQQAAGLGVSQQLRILEPVSDVRPYYSNALATLQLSTKAETFGRVVAESLACGTPVLGYARGGVGELLRAHFPFGAVAPQNLVQLMERTLSLVAGQNPAISRTQLPNLKSMQDATLALYERLIKGNRGEEQT
jgi:glycosyltransferase involved in cell wall biosynthesis